MMEDIIVAAHEMGHILGAEHDYPNSTRSCVDTLGYIMSWTAGYEDHPFEWSECSKKNLRDHLNSRAAHCYHNENPHDDLGPPLDEILVGKKIRIEEQCDRLGYGKVCESDNVCQNLRCRHTFWFCVYTDKPALDGTRCNDGGTCRNGVCEK